MSKRIFSRLSVVFILTISILCGTFIAINSNLSYAKSTSSLIKNNDTIHDTVYIEKIVHDTVQIVNYVDTNIIILHKKAFLYIKDTFQIDERTYYVTEDDDTIKVFYHDYTYYIFNYFFKDTLVTVDSVLGCDLYTHCICDERERIVIFHTCEGESRMIINMLKKEGKK